MFFFFFTYLSLYISTLLTQRVNKLFSNKYRVVNIIVSQRYISVNITFVKRHLSVNKIVSHIYLCQYHLHGVLKKYNNLMLESMIFFFFLIILKCGVNNIDELPWRKMNCTSLVSKSLQSFVFLRMMIDDINSLAQGLKLYKHCFS